MENQENRKTVIYVLVAGMALVVAWEPWRPAPPDHSAPPAVGTKVFPDLKDPLAAKSLEIMKFDEETATIRPIKVAQQSGLWSIPSHSGYPADARDHMAEAATALIDLEIQRVASTSPGDQELYGVITPDPQKLRQGMTGVGTRVTLRDGKDKVLADLVIGKEDKSQTGVGSGMRFVRQADRDAIYVVKIKTDRLSTKFEDWIEKDLLKLNAFDVRQAGLSDYSIEQGVTADGKMGLMMHPRSRVKLAFDDSKSSWSLLELSEFDKQGKEVPAKLADDEELDSEKLNGLKTALDDLQIIDVERKPKGLSQDLRASEEFVKDNEARASLISRGFYPVPIKDHMEIFSSEGEATCATKEGVRYVLRFGNLAGGVEEKDDGAEGDKPKSNPALNRYLFVMAQFDESQIPKPELEAVPGAEKATDEKPGEAKPADAKPADAKPSEGQAKPDAEKTGEAKADAPAAEPKPGTKAPAARPNAKSVPQKKTAAQEGKQEAPAAKDAPAKKADAPANKADAPANKADAEKGAAPAEADKPAAKPEGEAEPADAAKEAQKKPETSPTAEEEKKIAVEKENKRKQDEYNDAVKKGQEKVKELNDRFADWYFIISDDVYKKIHLGRADIVKKKAAKEEATDKPAGEAGADAAEPTLKADE
jgi:hypothetical protein